MLEALTIKPPAQRGMHWPPSNLADILVVGGAGLLLLVSSMPDTARRT